MSNAVSACSWQDVSVAPAAGVVEQPHLNDDAARVAFFEANGFVLYRGLIAPELLARVDADLADVCRRRNDLPRVGEGIMTEDPATWPSPDEPVFRKVGGLSEFTDSWPLLVRQLVERSVLPQLLGRRMRIWRDVVMMKQARVGRCKPWHQDGVYWPFRPFNQVSAFCALDACTPENGALQVIPGSHTRMREHHGEELQITLTPQEQAATRFVSMQPGDVLLFHSLLLHGSEPNRSQQHRRVAITSFMADGLTYIHDGEPPQRPLIEA